MRIGFAELSGRVSFISGQGKGSGKTCFLNYALSVLREGGEKAAFLGVGLDGEGSAVRPGATPIPVFPGECFASTDAYLRRSGCEPEILAVLPGRSALGRLAVARARRPGLAVLVGPERNEYAAEAVRVMREEAGARTVLVDLDGRSLAHSHIA